jgi:hypothetical protein
MEQDRDPRFFPHIHSPTFGHTMWEFRFDHSTLQQVYEINRNILKHTVWSTVFNVQDVFTPLPPGTNRFVYIWGLVIFNNPVNLAGLQQFITPFGNMDYIQ